MSTLSREHIAAGHLLPSITMSVCRRLIADPDVVWPLTPDQWSSLGANPAQATALSAESQNSTIHAIAETLQNLNISVVTYVDPAYPPLLREIPSPPPILYVRGNVKILSSLALAVVGTRQPTRYGLDVTKNLVAAAGRFTGWPQSQRLTIVSGLAYGIDATAHAAALRSGAPTVAVLGSGVDVIYPWPHRQLADDIINHGGAVISEFPLGAKPERSHFPQRNRIISGLARAVLLVEAGDKSGALITAKFAIDQNRDVLAVPGLITSPQSLGPHNWLKLGAKLVTSIEDIIDVYIPDHQRTFSKQNSSHRKDHRTTNQAQRSATDVPAVRQLSNDPIELAVVEILQSGPLHIDEILRKSRLDTSVVTITISLLEIRGVIEHTGGMIYRLT